MNAINKAGRPIIPSRSSDEEFFIGSRARKSGYKSAGGKKKKRGKESGRERQEDENEDKKE